MLLLYGGYALGGYARPALASVGVWKYSLSEASWSISRLSSAIRPSAVLIGMQSWQRGSPQGWREYSQYCRAPASSPSAISQRSASLSLSASRLPRSTALVKAESNVSAISVMGPALHHPASIRQSPRSFGRRSADIAPFAMPGTDRSPVCAQTPRLSSGVDSAEFGRQPRLMSHG